MYYILLNLQRMLDADNKPIQYASKEDALAAISYLEFAQGDDIKVIHYLDYYKIQDGIEERF